MRQRKLLIGLIGAGIQHSLSPAMHEREARQQGLRLHYQLIDVDRAADGAAALPRLIEAARTMGFAGLNITYPCKQAVIPLLDDLSDEATAMGAVNTVVFDGTRAIGHNTDGSGWAWGFRRTLPDADLSRVVLLGAGGAGSAIAHAVLRLGAGQLTLVDADAARSVALADDLNKRYGGARARGGLSVEAALADASGLIHATPTGMAKLPGLPLPTRCCARNCGSRRSCISRSRLRCLLRLAAPAVRCAMAARWRSVRRSARFTCSPGCSPTPSACDGTFWN